MIRLFNGTININVIKNRKWPHRIVCINGVVKYIAKHNILTNTICLDLFICKPFGTYNCNNNIEIRVLTNSKIRANSDGTSHLT